MTGLDAKTFETPEAIRGFLFSHNRKTPIMNDQTKIAIDGKEYLIADLPNEAKEQLANITLVDRKITETQQEVAILQTARNAYAAALTAALPKN